MAEIVWQAQAGRHLRAPRYGAQAYGTRWLALKQHPQEDGYIWAVTACEGRWLTFGSAACAIAAAARNDRLGDIPWSWAGLTDRHLEDWRSFPCDWTPESEEAVA